MYLLFKYNSTNTDWLDDEPQACTCAIHLEYDEKQRLFFCMLALAALLIPTHTCMSRITQLTALYLLSSRCIPLYSTQLGASGGNHVVRLSAFHSAGHTG